MQSAEAPFANFFPPDGFGMRAANGAVLRSFGRVEKTAVDQRTHENTGLGKVFGRKNWFFGDFGVPGRSFGKPLARILGPEN